MTNDYILWGRHFPKIDPRYQVLSRIAGIKASSPTWADEIREALKELE